MPIDPATTYNAKVLAKGYEVSGDARSGIKATVPYLLTWANAFGFTNTILGPVTAVRVGQMTFTVPYAFAGADIPVYAQRYKITPCGADGTAPITNRGLRAGEFFTHAVVTVEFEQVAFSWEATDDPNNLQQLDPANPITLCEQSVKIGGKMVTRKGLGYRYSDDNKPVQGDAAVFRPEAKLCLKFPRVSYLPWQLLLPYVGKTNSSALLGCAAETLLLEAPNTDIKLSINSSTPIEQAVTLEFAYDPDGWNKMPKPDGTIVSVYRAGDSSNGIYLKADFRAIFDTLSYAQGS